MDLKGRINLLVDGSCHLEYAAERKTPLIAYKGFGAVTRILN